MMLENKVAIVTGGSQGLGRSVALGLAREGAEIVIGDVSPPDNVAQEIESIGRSILALKVDVTKIEDVERMVKETLDKFGKINILVNNAGVISVSYVADLSEKEWDRIFNVNVKGVFLCSKAVIPTMMKQKNGKIINISSAAGKTGYGGGAHYCASKFAVIGFTQSLAKELAEYGVNVNAVCPGIIYTDMWRYLSEELAKWEGLTPEATFKKFVKEMIPLGRPQKPEDIANMVVFLASQKSDNITGQALNVTGGQVMH